MAIALAANTWIFVLVQHAEGGERMVGQYDSEHKVRFIPIYLDRDSAQQGMVQIVRDRGKCEIQAIIYEDLLRYAADSRSLIFILDGDGVILSKMGPDGRLL